MEWINKLKPGDLVGVETGWNERSLAYTTEFVKLTRTQVVTADGRWRRDDGSPIPMRRERRTSPRLIELTQEQIEEHRRKQAEEEEYRARNKVATLAHRANPAQLEAMRAAFEAHQ